MKNSAIALMFALGAIAALPAHAADSSGASAANKNADAKAALSDGEVKKVDKDAGKITIKHGPLVNLDMPPMTMVFRVKDKAFLDQVKMGDKIRFKADKIEGAYTVVSIEAAQ